MCAQKCSRELCACTLVMTSAPSKVKCKRDSQNRSPIAACGFRNADLKALSCRESLIRQRQTASGNLHSEFHNLQSLGPPANAGGSDTGAPGFGETPIP